MKHFLQSKKVAQIKYNEQMKHSANCKFHKPLNHKYKFKLEPLSDVMWENFTPKEFSKDAKL